jgi:hypothetical protein
MRMRFTNTLQPFLSAILILLLLIGCQSAVQVTQTAPANEAEYPSPPIEQPINESYPAPLIDADGASGTSTSDSYPVPPEVQQPEGPGPGGPGPGMAPAIENLSRMTARVLKMAPADDMSSYTRLGVEVLTSEQIEGMPDLIGDLVGKQVDLFVDNDRLPQLQAGDVIEVDVSLAGDEWGQKLIARQVRVVEP